MAVKKRNPWFVVIVSIVTFGIYALYWFYKTVEELNEVNKGGLSPMLALIGLFVPIVNIYVLWKYCVAVEEASKKAQNWVVLFICWLVFFPVAQYLTQVELNKFAKE